MNSQPKEEPMQQPDLSTDEIRDLIAKGWTPPGEAMEPYRHLLRPFYDAQGWNALPAKVLDRNDCKNIVALIATFEHFGLEIPPQMPSERQAA